MNFRTETSSVSFQFVNLVRGVSLSTNFYDKMLCNGTLQISDIKKKAEKLSNYWNRFK